MMVPPPPMSTSRRDNEPVSSLPPPSPSADRPVAPPPPVPADGWDWDRAKELAIRWFRPLTERHGWVALVYLFVGAIAGPIAFGLFVAAAAVTFGLSFVIVGLLLIVPLLLFAELICRFEQSIAGRAGFCIELRDPVSLDGAGVKAPFRALADPVRWRYVGFVLANVIAAPLLFALGSFPLSIVAQAVLGDGVVDAPFFTIRTGIDLAAAGILALPLAALVAGAIPRVAMWTAGLKTQFSSWLIGTDRLALAEQRVSVLSSQRCWAVAAAT